MRAANCVNCQAPRTENRYTTAKHATNALATTALVGGTGVVLNKGVKLAQNVCSDAIALSNHNNGSKILGTKTGKVFRFFENMGQKIFKDNTKAGKAIERFVTGKLPSGGQMYNAEQIKAVLKKSKTIGAMVLTAGVAALGLIAKGIYNAGKINGEAK